MSFKIGTKVRSKQPYGAHHREGVVIAPRTAKEKRYVKAGYVLVMIKCLDLQFPDVPQFVEPQHYEEVK